MVLFELLFSTYIFFRVQDCPRPLPLPLQKAFVQICSCYFPIPLYSVLAIHSLTHPGILLATLHRYRLFSFHPHPKFFPFCLFFPPSFLLPPFSFFFHHVFVVFFITFFVAPCISFSPPVYWIKAPFFLWGPVHLFFYMHDLPCPHIVTLVINFSAIIVPSFLAFFTPPHSVKPPNSSFSLGPSHRFLFSRFVTRFRSYFSSLCNFDLNSFFFFLTRRIINYVSFLFPGSFVSPPTYPHFHFTGLEVRSPDFFILLLYLWHKTVFLRFQFLITVESPCR